MVRGNQNNSRRRPNRRRKSNMVRSSIRQLSKAVDFRVLATRRLPKDPPSTLQHVERSYKIPIRFMYDSKATASAWAGSAPGASFEVPNYVVKKNNNNVPEAIAFTIGDISKVFTNITGMGPDIGKNLDIAILKVCFWGPVIGIVSFPSTIELNVDLGNQTTGVSLADTGTTINRPAVGCTMPFTSWFESNSTRKFAFFEWDTQNKIGAYTYPEGVYEIGFAHITVLGRFVQDTT